MTVLKTKLNLCIATFSIAVAALLSSTSPLMAQRDIQVSQHMFNRTYYNPAATGASSYLNVFLLAREQWAGWEGAPSTQILSAHSYFPSIQSGLGLNVLNDRAGLGRMFTTKLMYAYHLRFNDDSYLSMGLGAGVCYQYLNYSEQVAKNPDDPNLVWENTGRLNPDFDLGFEYNRERLKAGISLTHINKMPNNDNDLSAAMHLYGYLRYEIPVSYSWTVTPSFFTQSSKGSTHFEGGFLGSYEQRYWLGAFYRMDEKAKPESCVLMAGLIIARHFRVGYSFDYNISSLSGYTQNTHEVFLHLQLPLQRTFTLGKSPRFFE